MGNSMFEQKYKPVKFELYKIDPNTDPDDTSLYDLEEIEIILQDIIGLSTPDNLSERQRGDWFNSIICKKLGYYKRPSNGKCPDIRHQLLEIKHHTGKQVNIDFGRHHPNSEEIIENTNFRHYDIRYVIAIAPPPDKKICNLIIGKGNDIHSTFRVPENPTIKYQKGISKKWYEQNSGVLRLKNND